MAEPEPLTKEEIGEFNIKQIEETLKNNGVLIHTVRGLSTAFASLPPFFSTMKLLQLLLCGIFLPPLSSRGIVGSTAANAAPTLENAVPTSGKCWVFMHLNKSGGTTVKKILEDGFPHRLSIYASPTWKRGEGRIQTVGNQLTVGGNRVIAGGYLEALRLSSAADETCHWFTVFRHPVSRMVSAYYYCQKNAHDMLCGTNIMNAKDIDLFTFAKHWGNFAMRQFALSRVSADDVIAYSRSDAAKSIPGRGWLNRWTGVPGWYLVKMYLNDNFTTSEQVEMPDEAMYEMLQPVQDELRDRYTVGILEEFNTTLNLFDVALDMPGVNWHKQYTEMGTQNMDTEHKEEERASLEEAWTNSDIKKHMQLDIILYEHAVDVFHQQARAYGLE